LRAKIVELLPERGDKSHTMNLCKIAAALFLLILSVTNVLAQAARSNPDNTIDCTALKKKPDGWFVEAATTFNFGGMNMKLSNKLIQPHSGFEMNGVDLYDAIERKCGGNRS
jgi:hypothetical protein